MNLEENNSIHHNDGRRRLSEKFDNLIQELSGKDIQEKLTLILSPEHKDTINKRIITLRTLTIEQLSDMLFIDASILESHFGEKFDHLRDIHLTNKSDELAEKNNQKKLNALNEFDRDQALKMSTQRMPNGEPIPYKTGNLKRK